MARIPLTAGFTLIPEGTYTFTISNVSYDEDFGKMLITLKTDTGMQTTERFTLKNQDDSWNDKALSAFSFFAKTAMNDFTAEDIDPQAMVGHKIQGDIVHTTMPNRNDPSKTVTFVNVKNLVPVAVEEVATESAEPVDLGTLLG